MSKKMYKGLHLFKRRSLPGALALALALPLSAEVSDNAVQSAYLEKAEFSIQAQSLSSALIEFSKQAGIQVIVQTETLQGMKTDGIIGQHTLQSALVTLLSDNGLTYEPVSDDTVVVSPKIVAPASDDVEEAGETEVDEEILVTGSRIRRTGLETSSPVTVLTSERMRQRGFTNVADLLRDSPLIVSTRSADITNSSQDPLDPSNAGVETVSLRGLSSLSGSSRTLSLVNGRRHVASVPGSSDVDLNTIPSSLVQRVEIVTGGSSAVYGSEAIAGVINYVLKEDFEGFDVSAQYGKNQAGDGESKSLSVTWGTNFDNGNLALNIERNENAVSLFRERSFLDNANIVVNPPGLASYSDPRSALYTRYGGLLRDPTSGTDELLTDVDGSITGTAGVPLRFDQNGELTEFVQDRRTPLRSSGGDGVVRGVAAGPNAILSAPTDRTIFNTFFNYDVNEDIAFFLEGKYVDTRGEVVRGEGAVLTVRGIDVATNPHLSDTARAQLSGFGITTFGLARSVPELTPQNGVLNTELFRVVTGLEGTWAEDYNWEFSVNYGKSERESGNLDFDQALLESLITNGTVNLFGEGSLTQQQIDGFSLLPNVQDETAQKIVSFSISGPVAELPAGTLDFAAGIEYREEDITSAPNADAQRRGLIFGERQAVDGSYDVKEIFGELNVPLLADAPGAQLLNLDLSARLGDYSTVGNVFSWKSGLSWVPADDVRFRASYGTSVRAPSGSELFRPEQSQFELAADLCSPGLVVLNASLGQEQIIENCRAIAPNLDFSVVDAWNALPEGPIKDLQAFIIAGTPSNYLLGFTDNITRNNPNLQEETATTFTAGVVLTPEFLDGLTVTMDYWSMEVEDAIEILDSGDYLNFCLLGSPDSATCAAVQRDPATSRIIANITEFSNVTSIELAGYDLGVDYGFDLGDGSLNLGLNATYLDQFDTTSTVDGTTVNSVGGSNRRFNATASATYSRENWSLFTNARYQDGRNSSDIADFAVPISSVTYYDASFNWRVNDNWSLTFGSNNILDTKPKTNDSILIRNFDLIGRTFFLSVNGSFN